MVKRPFILCLGLCFLAGVIFTWPLTPNFFSSIPYTLKPIAGYEKVPLMPGDHLQTYYWFWLLSDNLFGHSSFLTNPYEFNGPSGPMSTVYANFPFSLLYILLLFLGPVGAYNGLILLSFILCGLSMFLLAREWTKDLWASLLAGLVFATNPLRVSQIAGGQLPGYIIFFLPLCLFYIDRALTTGRWIYGGAGGLCLVLLSLMDSQTSYLTVLALGIYLPSRILLWPSVPINKGKAAPSPWLGFAGAFMGGLSMAVFLWMRFRSKTGLPLLHPDLFQPAVLGPISTLITWLYLSALFSKLTALSFSEARQTVGKTFFFFMPLALYVLKNQLNIPHLGLILVVSCSGLFIIALIGQWIRQVKQKDRPPLSDWPKIIPVLTGIGLGLAVAAVYLTTYVRTKVFLPSLAGKGRSLSEVLLFSPRLDNLFFWQDINQERFILLGWVLLLLALFGLLLLFKKHPKNPGQIALAGLLSFIFTALTIGPRLATFPLYQTLFRYFPFFNYSRRPDRFIMVGLIFLSLLAGIALTAFREWSSLKGWVRLRIGVPLLVILLVLAEYQTWQPLGLSLMTKDNRIYNHIETGLAEKRRVLELPIWPGDSHQSSAYEYTVTRTRKPMINGYAPVVFRDYIRQVFWPLYPLDFGELGSSQIQELIKLKVGLVTFHDNSQIYPEKISPFPPRLALKRLKASPFLNMIDQDQDISLFKAVSQNLSGNRLSSISSPTNQGQEENPSGIEAITSPVSAVYYASHLRQETGRMKIDSSASGYYLLLEEKELNRGRLVLRPGVGGNIISASPGLDQPGYLVITPSRVFPSGKYRARFRMKAELAGNEKEVGRIEVIEGGTRILTQKILRGSDFSRLGKWEDIEIDFELSQITGVGFKVFFAGTSPLVFNVGVVSFADQNEGPGVVEAEDLLRQTGAVVPDPLASSKEAVFGQAGFHPPIYLCYGPYRTVDPGRYRSSFSLRLKNPPLLRGKREVALLEVATDLGKRVFCRKWVKIQDLKPDLYTPVGLDFEVPFRCELGYRVKFTGQTDLLVDRVELIKSGAVSR